MLRTFAGSYQRTLCILCGMTVIAIFVSTFHFNNDRAYRQTMAHVSQTQLVFQPRDRDEDKHLAFLKVHKTGSSSLQNLFIRFGESRNLTFILASVTSDECGGSWRTNCISFTRTLHDGNIMPPPENKSYEILCSHVIYNRHVFREFLPHDTKYIASVRQPVKRLESAIAFFNIMNDSEPLSNFLQNPEYYSHQMTNNRMAFEFGFNKEWFPTATQKTLSDAEKVKVVDYVHTIIKDFDLIIVNERMDESLIVMRRMLGWTMKDIIYSKKLVRQHSHFRKKDVGRIKQYLYLDSILYKSAVKSLEFKLSNTGPDFADELNVFKSVNKIVNEFCDCAMVCEQSADSLLVKATRWNDAFTVTHTFCEDLNLVEKQHLQRIRERQYN